MPYIKNEDRQSLLTNKSRPKTPGELNFMITNLIVEYVKLKGLSYSTVNEVVGVLSCCMFELYRRVAAPYEDKKIAENGDCYPTALRTP